MTDRGSNYSRLMSGVRQLVGAEVLVVDQDESVQKGITQLLSSADLHVTCVSDPREVEDALGKKFYSVVIADMDTPEPRAGLDVIHRVHELSPTSVVVILTPRKSFDDVVDAIRAGAVDVIWKSQEAVDYLEQRVLAAAGRSVDKREVNSILNDVRNTHEDFLKRFMDAEQRCVDLTDQLAGRDPERGDLGEEVRVMVVDANTRVADALIKLAPPHFQFDKVLTGGEALDRASSSRYHIAMITTELADLPASMVVRSIRTQVPDTLVIQYTPRGPVEIVETRSNTRIVDVFNQAEQITGKLDELADRFRQKARERRYTQAFRERHYDFLRRYVELKLKIDRALGEEE